MPASPKRLHYPTTEQHAALPLAMHLNITRMSYQALKAAPTPSDARPSLAQSTLPSAWLRQLALVLCLLAGSGFSYAQQVFPVAVTGQLMPPNSLRINDYFTGMRDNDLMFTVMLNDPIQQTRQVKYQLLVESDGGVILRSNLDLAPIVTLDRDFPEMLTGADLAPYFSTLQNVNGTGIPLFLPPGLNGFCIEVHDVATDKIISNQGCARGFFNLAQPPILQSPTCDVEIENTETQNLSFNWLPMHNASGNPINDINYQFQLVRIPEGFQNPKDAFDASQFVYQTNVRNMTGLLYTEAEPLLERGEIYAWRVRAQALTMDEQVIPLFDNNGYSAICTFSYLEPTPPADPADFSSCTGSPCNFVGSIGTEPKGEDLFTGDVIKVGYYNLTVGEVNYDSGNEAYSGNGTIYVEFLGTSIEVEFNELQVNQFNRAYGQGEVKARFDDEGVVPPGFVGDFQAMAASQAENFNFSDDAAASLEGYFGNSPNKLVSNLAQAGSGGTSGLPIGLDVDLSAIGQAHVIAITDMVFTPTTSKLNAVYTLTVGESVYKFGSTGVCFRSRGLVETNPKLHLLSELPLETTLGLPMVLETASGAGTGTSVAWSCDGFESFSLQGRVELDPEVVIPVGGSDEPIVARFSTSADQLSNFTATLEMDAFTLPGLEDFTFNIGEAFFDYSSVAQLENVQWPEGYDAPEVDWEGFYFPDLTVTIPNVFGGSGEAPEINGNNIIFDSEGFSGTFSGINLLQGDDATVGGWPFNIDLFSLSFSEGELTASEFDGKCRLPFMEEGWLSFDGAMEPTTDTITGLEGWEFALGVNSDPVDISIFRATFNFDEGSTIVIPYAGGEFGFPRCNLAGGLAFNIGDGDIGFDPDMMGLIGDLEGMLASLGIGDLSPSMDLSGLDFSGMQFDWNADPKFTFGEIRPVGLDLSFLGISADLAAITWGEIGTGLDGLPKYGFNFDISFPDLGPLAPDVDFSIGFNFNSSANPNSPSGSLFDFSGFNLDFALPELSVPDFDFSCGDDVPEIEFSSDQAVASFPDIPALKVGFFDLTDIQNLVQGEVDNAFNGVGKINVPALGPFGNVTVELNNVVVNEAGQVIAGEITTAIDDAFAGADGLQGAAGDLLDAANGKVAELSGAARDFFTLPIVLGVTADGASGRDQGLIITAMNFGPEGATVDAKVVVPLGGDQYIEFNALDLALVPGGIAGGELRLGLTSDFDLPIPGGEALSVRAFDGENGSYIAVDCGGFVAFNLAGSYPLPEDKFTLADGGGAVDVGFSINTTEWGEFLGTIEATEPFTLLGIPDFTFAMGEGRLDFSRLRNPGDMAFPEGYAAGGGTWQGFFAPEMTVTVPSLFTGGGEPATFTAANVVIDSLGLSTDVSGQSLLALSNGALGNWGFSIDSFAMRLRQGDLVDGIFAGGMQLPIMDESETLPYTASFAPAASPEDDYNFDFTARPETVTIALLRSRFTFDTTSTITVGYENGEFRTPVADLSGFLSFDAPSGDNGFTQEFQDIIADIQDQFPDLGDLSPEFNMEGIAFEHLRFDPYGDRVLSAESIIPANTSVSFMGQTADLTGVELADLEIDEDAIAAGINENARLLGFNFETTVGADFLGLYAPTVTLSMQITEDVLPAGDVDYDFYKFDLDYEIGGLAAVNADCRGEQEEIVFADADYEGSFTRDSFLAGYFVIDDLNITADDEQGKLTGTGRVTVPVLGPMRYLDVAFTDIQLDADGRMRAGEIITQSDLDEDSTDDLDGILGAAQAKLDAVADAFKLPIMMGNEALNFTIVGLRMQPTEASVQARVIVPTGDASYVEFVGDGLQIVPNGIAGAEIKMFLGQDTDLEGLVGMPLMLKGGTNPETASYATCDCDGFQGFTLKAEYEFPTDQLENLTNEGEAVVAALNINATAWGDFTGSIDGFDEFAIPGLEGFSFNVPGGLFDFSDTRSLASAQYPEGFGDVGVEWNGFVIPAVEINLPEFFVTGDELPSFEGADLIIDSRGLFGDFQGVNLFSADIGDLGGWGFAMDSLNLKFWEGSLSLGNFSGGLRLPIMGDGELLPLLGWIDSDFNFGFDIKPLDVDIDLFNATFSFDPTSSIDIDFIDGSFSMPKVNLDGIFNFSLPEGGPGMDGDFMNQLMGLLGSMDGFTPDINLDGIKFTGMKFDWSLPNKFSIGSFEPINANIDFWGLDIDLSSIQWLQWNPDSNSSNGWALNFNLSPNLGGITLPDLTFSFKLSDLWSGSSGGGSSASSGGGKWFDFSGLAINWGSGLSLPSFDFECEAEPFDLSFNADSRKLTALTSIPEIEGVPTIQIGYFNVALNDMADMALDEATGALTGVGEIKLDFLGPFSDLAVEFKDVVVNDAGRIVEGTVKTSVDELLDVGDGLPDPNALLGSVTDKLNAAAGAVNDFFTLPVVLGAEDADGLNQGLIITGVELRPDKAVIDAEVVIPVGNTHARFGLSGLEIVPGGIADFELVMGLLDDITLPAVGGMEPLEFEAYDAESGEGSRITLDCGGFVEFELVGTYTFPKSQLVDSEFPDKPVKARFAMNTQKWGEFLGTFTGMEQFAIAGYTEFPFSIEGGVIDYSSTRNSANAVYPEGYDVDNSWTGFFLPSMSVGMPSIFSSGDEPLTFTASNMIIDGDGVTAKVQGDNVFNLSTGSLGSWGYSMDSITMEFNKNNYVSGRFGGGLQLPLMSEDEYIPYDADLNLSSLTGLSVGFEAKPDEVDISLLKSKFKFDRSSVITVGIADGKFQTPYVNLSGLFTVDFTGDGSESSSEITDLLNEIAEYFSSYDIPDLGFSFASEGIRFENFIFDMQADQKFSIGDITPEKTSINFLGQSADLSGINLHRVDAFGDLEMLAGKLDEQVNNLSFSFETKVFTQFLGGLAPTVKMDMVMAENFDADGDLDYDFKGFNLAWEAPAVNFSCTSNLEPLTPSATPYSGAFPTENSQIKVGRFVMDELNFTQNNDGLLSGTGRIEVPIFGPMRYMDVAFEEVKLNAEGEIYDGEVITRSDMSNPAETDDMGILMNTALNKLSETANDLFQLPIVMGDTESFAFTVVGLSFGPSKASLQTRLIVNTGNDRYLEFVAEGLEIVPDGISDVSARLGLAREFTLPGVDNLLPVRLLPYNREEETGTYASCDCEGFQLFNLDGEAEFSRNYLLSKTKVNEAGEPATVKAKFHGSSEGWGTMLGNLTVNDSIYLVGAQEMPFYLGEALFDMADKEDHEGITWPEGYDVPEDGSWNGVYINSASMPLPTILSDYSEGEPGVLRVQNLVADSRGFTGVFAGKNLLDMETTEFFGFGMALDTFSVRFASNNLVLGQMDGRFNLPLLEAGEGIPFSSFVSPGQTPNSPLNFLWLAKPAIVQAPLISAELALNNESKITIERTPTGFSYPKFDLSGSLRVMGDGQGMGNELDEFVGTLNEMTGTEILPDFNLDSISFEHMVFDPDGEGDDYFSIGSITPNKSEVTFLGQTVLLEEINFGELVELGMQPDSAAAAAEDALRQLAFRFDFTVDLPVLGEMPLGVALSLDELEDAVNGVKKIDYKFGGFKFDYDFPDLSIPDFTCESPAAPEPPEDQTVATLSRRTKVNINGFKLTIKELSGKSGKGTVRIPFMNYNMNVTFKDLEVNAAGDILSGEILTDTEGSLVPDDAMDTESVSVPIVDVGPALTSFLEKTQEFFTLPISLREKLEETAGLTMPEGLDLILLGIVWTPEGGRMNMAITVPSIVEGGDPLQFGVRGLNIRPDGVDLGELKVFLAETIKF